MCIKICWTSDHPDKYNYLVLQTLKGKQTRRKKQEQKKKQPKHSLLRSICCVFLILYTAIV